MASRTPLSETTHPVSSKSDLRLLLLGPRNVGKSTLGNRILGGAEFDTSVTTAVCEKRDGMVAGRQVTVVDTPGWLVPLTPDVSPELLKREVVYSACLCPPGPHCALLVLWTDMLFSVEVVGSILQHLDLLSESLFEHLLVVFSRGEQLGGRSIEEHVEESGEVLQFLLEECSHRYHVVSSADSQGAEIPELLRKIDAMVRGHGGQHYEMDPEIQHAVAERRKGEEENAKARAMTVQKQRETLRSQIG
ncbi:GTPase IMAP family member 4-like [Engraulis encrasicolus]|uniref:GTPase IMAP family member 4-like n=1 Tax=Engraulis encrasicolus TaxID=184585 RepID=UPI002FD2349B